MQPQFGESMKQVAQMALRFMNGGRLPEEFRGLEADWAPVSQPPAGITSDAVTKEIAAGAIPATSDVTLKKLGYSAVDRQRLEQDRVREQGRADAQAIIDAVNGVNGGNGTAGQ